MLDSRLFPADCHALSELELAALYRQLSDELTGLLDQLKITDIPAEAVARVYLPLAAVLARARQEKHAPLVVGINGAQGSGKTTLCQLLARILERGFQMTVATLSIDDFYLTHAERGHLGETLHPLLATRGVPGTHDVPLAQQILTKLTTPEPAATVAIPRFDKARDDRQPRSTWPVVTTPVDLVLFEGWCVGARPQADDALQPPVNVLEAQEDPSGTWRRHVNAQLQGDYRQLFAHLDLLVMLQVPGMQSVYDWRCLQERKLAEASRGRQDTRVMSADALRRFIMHYERLTRHMLAEMPQRADLVLRLDRSHQVAAVKINRNPQKMFFET